jgi:cytochrome oxidase Cu insertion factor (SCO1/SenC/PrrC family)
LSPRNHEGRNDGRSIDAARGSALITPGAAQQPKADPLASRFGGSFTLTDHTGKRVTDRDYRGQFLVVYFGFTRCTDACPIDVPSIAAALDRISPLDARVQPLFISVDPEDSPELLKTYVETFHPRLVGLTGSEAELAAVAKAYRVHRYRVQRQSSAGGPRHHVQRPEQVTSVHGDKPHSPGQNFTIDHGTLTYLMGPDGQFLTLIPRGAGTDRIAAVLRTYVKA